MKPRYRLSACPSLLLSLVLSVVVLRASASRVLLISAQLTSHLLELRDLGVSLAARGHEVWMTLETDHPTAQLMAPRPLRIVTYGIPTGAARLSDKGYQRNVIAMTSSEFWKMALTMRQTLHDHCMYVMQDADFISPTERHSDDIQRILENGSYHEANAT